MLYRLTIEIRWWELDCVIVIVHFFLTLLELWKGAFQIILLCGTSNVRVRFHLFYKIFIHVDLRCSRSWIWLYSNIRLRAFKSWNSQISSLRICIHIIPHSYPFHPWNGWRSIQLRGSHSRDVAFYVILVHWEWYCSTILHPSGRDIQSSRLRSGVLVAVLVPKGERSFLTPKRHSKPNLDTIIINCRERLLRIESPHTTNQSQTMMRQFLLLLLLLPLTAMAGSYENVLKMFHFSNNDDVENAMADTKLDQKLEYVVCFNVASKIRKCPPI